MNECYTLPERGGVVKVGSSGAALSRVPSLMCTLCHSSIAELDWCLQVFVLLSDAADECPLFVNKEIDSMPQHPIKCNVCKCEANDCKTCDRFVMRVQWYPCKCLSRYTNLHCAVDLHDLQCG